ncbi:MAG: hypothetical protein ACYCO9_22290 [Streptosporangiaceae bacterium]
MVATVPAGFWFALLSAARSDPGPESARLVTGIVTGFVPAAWAAAPVRGRPTPASAVAPAATAAARRRSAGRASHRADGARRDCMRDGRVSGR